MTNEERLAKNKSISQTKRETIERHKSMQVKTFDVKIQENKLSKAQREALEKVFLEQKWYKNYILNWCEQGPGNKITRFNTKQNQITKKDKDMNDVLVTIKYLTAQSKQCLISRMCANIKTLHTLKVKGLQKPGRLKFSKEETIIDLKQYGISHKIISSKRVSVSGLSGRKKAFPVNGLDQFINIPGIEFANARLLHRATGYFIQFVCYIPKENKKQEKIEKTIGIDFGCSTAFTTSEGEKISALIPESERLKRCQKNMARKQKGSKNWLKDAEKVRKEYQKITNRKSDLANKLVHKFCQYETVVIQDEQLQSWKKNGHGKAVQHSVLGRVKAKLKLKPNVVILGKSVPTTKLCTKCGAFHDELKVWNRTFNCDCGVSEDRDIHAAKNMVWLYENKVGVGRTKFKRVEMEALVSKALSFGPEKSICESQLLSAKHEDSSLKAGISSQKQLHRKQKGSKRYYRLLKQIRCEYEHLSNKKADETNKLISYLLKNYDIVYFQDENISEWRKKKRSKRTGKKVSCFSFGKQIQSSYLGRVKAKLVSLENDKSFKVSKWSPTTKFCPQCGCLNKIGLNERTYHCDCGYSFDRDIHAAKNVKLFGSTKRAECLEQASVETLASAALEFDSNIAS